MSQRQATSPVELSRAVEDLRGPYEALCMASSGIAAAMHAGTATEAGVFWLLESVGRQLEATIVRLEAITRAGDG